MGLLGPLESIGKSLGLNDLPIIRGTGLFGPSSEQEQLQKAFENAQRQQQAYRPYQAAAYQQAVGNLSSLFGPISQALQSMYGTGYGVNTRGLQQPVISPGAFNIGNAPRPSGGGSGGPLSAVTPWFAK